MIHRAQNRKCYMINFYWLTINDTSWRWYKFVTRFMYRYYIPLKSVCVGRLPLGYWILCQHADYFFFLLGPPGPEIFRRGGLPPPYNCPLFDEIALKTQSKEKLCALSSCLVGDDRHLMEMIIVTFRCTLRKHSSLLLRASSIILSNEVIDITQRAKI